jgi:bifunctional non-homologous end joining protein LigD
VLEEFQAHWTVELDFADRFPLVVAAVAALPVRSCLIDGEAIVSDKSGLAVFELRSFRHDHDAVLCAFDLLEVDGEDLHRLPIEVRKAGRRRRSFRYPTRSTQRRVQSCALPCLSCS